MNPSDYQNLAERTECDQESTRCRLTGLTGQMNLPGNVQSIYLPARLNQGANGLASEAGEVLGLLEKWLYYGHPLDRDKVADELGDCLWYVAEMCNALHLNLSDVMEANIAKLKTRFPEKFYSHLAMEEGRNRDKEAEEIKDVLRRQEKGFSEALSKDAIEQGLKKSVRPVVLSDPDAKPESLTEVEDGKFAALVMKRKEVGMPLDLSHKWEDNPPSEIYRCRVCGAYSNMGSGHLPCPRNEEGSLKRDPSNAVITEEEK
jgi:NTP pyrophosphatase (non-canonical NTP hydrolase)